MRSGPEGPQHFLDKRLCGMHGGKQRAEIRQPGGNVAVLELYERDKMLCGLLLPAVETQHGYTGRNTSVRSQHIGSHAIRKRKRKRMGTLRLRHAIAPFLQQRLNCRTFVEVALCLLVAAAQRIQPRAGHFLRLLAVHRRQF